MTDNQRQTPEEVIQIVTDLFVANGGSGISLDPCSSSESQTRIGALEWYGPDHPDVDCRDGLWTWPETRTVFCNPPGGLVDGVSTKSGSLATKWWGHAVSQWSRYRELVFLGFNIELLRTSQSVNSCGVLVPGSVLCIPKARLRFPSVSGQVSKHPDHANCLVWLPGGRLPAGDLVSCQDRAKEYLGRLGAVGVIS